MRLLLTNDDGILAPGLEALYRAVADLGHVDVVAPDDSQSGVGHAISVLKPLLVRRLHVNNLFHGWSVAGRPADCVKLAMIDLLDQRPDLVLSGINAGANTGMNVLYSGTIAGAVEAALFGVPAIAFSLELSDELDFHMAGRIARDPRRRHGRSAAPRKLFERQYSRARRGLAAQRALLPQAPVNWKEHFRKEVEGNGRAIYWLEGRPPEDDGDPQYDFAAIRAGYVAITPLCADLTDRAQTGAGSGVELAGRFA